jgi:acetylornithine/succinyldiaminopimelate/putrescine aminotransferase
MGVYAPEYKWMQSLRKKCDEVGALLVLDEIQTGFGRTGTLFAFEKYGIVPDVILLGKALGGGMPLGAFVSSRSNMNAFTENPVLGHITTFGGHPLCAAAALATMTTLQNDYEDLIATIPQKEQLFKKLLQSNLKIKEIRSAGLFMALQLDNFEQLTKVIKNCISKGLITDWFLFNSSAMRIAPPLIINEDEIKIACDIINESIYQS